MKGQKLEKEIFKKYIEDSIQEMVEFANNNKGEKEEKDEQDK